MTLLKQRGAVFSSFVILLAIAALALLVNSFNRDVMNSRTLNSELLSQHLKMLSQGLSHYYVATCTPGIVLQTELLPKYLTRPLKLDEGGEYDLSIDDSGLVPTFLISVDINSTLDTSLFLTKLRSKNYNVQMLGNRLTVNGPLLRLRNNGINIQNHCSP